MDLRKIICIFCVLTSAYCQLETNSTDSENDLQDFNSTATNEHENATTKGDEIITGEEVNQSSSTELNENVTSVQIMTNFSACAYNPCKHGGSCVEDLHNPNLYKCFCNEGYNGNHCAVKDECYVEESGLVCSGGYCAYSKDLSSRTCYCYFDLFWDNTQKKCRAEKPPCFPNPCLNEGRCKETEKGRYTCDCQSGYEGSTCAVRNKCGEGDNCENGKCSVSEDSKLKSCSCNSNFYWNENTAKCEDVIPPCVPNPCGNDGQCELSMSGSYNCSCSGQYIDEKCMIENLCYAVEANQPICGGHGKCNVSEKSSKCICEDGYYWDEYFRTCREINKPCFPNPCLNDRSCIPLDAENFNCTCSEEYNGRLCEEVDLCVVQGGYTICGKATCESDHDLGMFYCDCGEGFYFDFQQRSCSEINFCPLMSCGENEYCVDSSCVCQENYKRNNETGKCKSNFCASNPCEIDEMMCTEGDGIKDFYCTCKEGYSFNGIHCIEATCLFPSFNDCDQICNMEGDSYTCDCLTNYFSLNDDNKTCTYTGNSTCINKTCNIGTCMREENDEEICVCPRGFAEQDEECVDMCSLGNLPEGYCPDNACEVTDKGFRCRCEGKYTLSADNVTCTNRKMCQKGEIGEEECKGKNAYCVEAWDSEAGYKCQCPFPKVETNEGICKDICSITENQRECSGLGARCEVRASGEKECVCPPLYQKPKNGDHCNKQAGSSYLMILPLDQESYKMQQSVTRIQKRSLSMESSIDYFLVKTDIENALSKIFPELIQSKLLSCKSNDNYYSCKIEVLFSSHNEDSLNRVKVSNLCVVNNNSSEKCLIPPSLVLRKDKIKNDLTIEVTNPCDEDIKRDLCGFETVCISSESKGSFNCTCSPGFEMIDRKYFFIDSDSFTEICIDVNECLETNSCPQNSICENTIGSYKCSCLPGYRIPDKSSDHTVNGCVEICNPNPCDHGNCKEKGDHDFECSCEAGFAGALCDLRDSNFKNAQTNTIIIGAVLGGVLLITMIISLTIISRLKKKKKSDDSDQMLYATEMTEGRTGTVNNVYQ